MNQPSDFAGYIRELGRGQRGSRDLSQDEACDAFRQILAGRVAPEQLGAFLMLMRVKGETAGELAGMVQACRQELFKQMPAAQVDLDWSSYAGKRRHLPWFLLSALLLAHNGVRVFMHGLSGRKDNRIYTAAALEALNITAAKTLDEAAAQLTEQRFSYLALEDLAPQLAELIQLRQLLGLRSPVNSAVRLLNPFIAPYLLQSIFHPPYKPLHQQAAKLLGQPHAAVIKGEGGEIERNPDTETEVLTLHHGTEGSELWPAIFPRRHLKDEAMDPQRLRGLWNGTTQDEYGEAAVAGTTAIALKLLGRAESEEDAQALAWKLWNERNRKQLLPG